MILAFGVFWVILFFSRTELGLKWVLICAVLGAVLLALFLLSSNYFVYGLIGQVILDIVLILFLFGGDIRIN